MSTTLIHVEQMKFNNGKIRVVEVPTHEFYQCDSIIDQLEMIFKYGQNNYQPQEKPSVSTGDVITIKGKDKYLVAPIGFEKLSDNYYNIMKNAAAEAIPERGHKFEDKLYNMLGRETFQLV